MKPDISISVKSAAAELAAYGRQPPLPYRVSWVDIEGSLQVEQWLRILPGKRYVGRASWQDREVLVKLFVGPRAADKATAEVAGHQRLQAAQLLTPALLAHGALADGRGAWVLFEFLAHALTLEQAAGLGFERLANVDTPLPAQTQQHLISPVATAIARLHRQGLQQKDIHPGNFLLADGQSWIIDTADVIPAVTQQERVVNLAVFLAQLPEALWADVWQHYQQVAAAGVDPDEAGYDKVAALAWQWQARRAKDLAEKSLRDCSLFSVTQQWRQFTSVWRAEAESIAPLLQDLDGALARSVMLKDGGSATVGLIRWDGREMVIKRYNLKGWKHRLKRFWRPTRAWHSWQAGHRLRVLGIQTPRPVAVVEERWGPLRGRGYLITEVTAGEDLVRACASGDQARILRVAERLKNMVNVMARHRISHGDFKATNLLWDEQATDNELNMIDLDAVCWHTSPESWKKASNKDMARLLRNWDAASPQYQSLQQMLESSIIEE